ncbi:MAG: Bax inhibitor-1 family protein [Candidatus Gracilibacteria bacterium]
MYTSETHLGNTQITSTFFGRVVLLFGLALGVSAMGAYVGFSNMQNIAAFNNLPLYMIGAMIAELVLIFTARFWSQTRPLNYILFAVFAFISGFTLAPIIFQIVLRGNGGVVVQALLATAVTFTAAGLIAWKTNINMFRFQGLLTMGLIGMIIIGIISMFFPMSGLTESVYSFVGILLFSGFIMFDVQRIRFNTSQNEIEVALALYLDIFNLFLYILRFLDRR